VSRAPFRYRTGQVFQVHLGSAFIDQLTCCHDAKGAIREEVAPHPMVMPDHGDCIQVGPIAHCMTVADNNDVVII